MIRQIDMRMSALPFSVLAALVAIPVTLSVSCSPDSPIYSAPALNSLVETQSNVSKPVLRATLPASWDENWYSSPVVFDLNNDGSNEIIAARHSVLYVWKLARTLLWRAPVGENSSSATDHGQSRMYCSPVVGDLNNDGFGEIAICYSTRAAVYDHNGMLLPGWPKTFGSSGDEIRSIAASDINNDGQSEIVVVKTSDGPVTMVWSVMGTALAGWPQVADRAEKNDYGGYNQNVGIADLDGNGVKDVVCTYDICDIGFFHSNGESFLANSMFSGKYVSSVPMFHDIALAKQGWGADGNDRDEFTDSPPAFADLDNDGLPEVILYSDHEKAGEYINRGNSLWAVNADLTRVFGFETPITTGGPLYTGYQDNIVQVAPAPCISKLGTAVPYIIVPSYDGYMRCYSNTGLVEWQVQFGSAGTTFTGAGEAVAGDLDNDGIPEVVFTTYSIRDDCSYLVILDKNGNLLHRISVSGRGSMAAPTLDDVDNDGVVEIVVSLKDVLGGGVGGVQIWDVASAVKNNLDWPTGRGNYLRTGEFE